MKKRFIISACILIFLIILLLIGTTKKDGTMLCTNKISSGNVDMVTKYKIYYENNNVTKVKSVETITTSDEELLNNYKMLLSSMYDSYKDLDHYSNDIVVTKDRLISTTIIDYKNIDIKKFTSIDRSNAKLFTSGKIKLKKIKSMYTKTGARCR